MDSTCVFIGLQVCFHNAMKRENDSLSNVVGCLQVVRLYTYIHTSYDMFPCLHSLVKISAKFLRILKSVNTLDCVVSGFYWSAFELPKTFTSVFTRLWRHGEHVWFLRWINYKKLRLHGWIYAFYPNLNCYLSEARA